MRNVFCAPADVDGLLTKQNEGVFNIPAGAVHSLLTGADVSIHDGASERTDVSSAVVAHSSTAPYGDGQRTTIYISDLVRAKVWMSNLARLWWAMNTRATRAEVGYAFERYCYDMLCAPGAGSPMAATPRPR